MHVVLSAKRVKDEPLRFIGRSLVYIKNSGGSNFILPPYFA